MMWISVEDRLPTEDDLIRHEGFWMLMYWLHTGTWEVNGWSSIDEVHSELRAEATHWQPLPEPPKSE